MKWDLAEKPINTFVVPFLRTDMIEECVKSIWRIHSPGQHRLILIDNSLHNFKNMPWIMENSHLYIKSYRNLGVWKSYNTGLRLATTEFITLMGDDTRLIHKKWFDGIADPLRKNENQWGFCASEINEYIPNHAYTEKEYDSLLKKSKPGHGRAANFHALVCKRKLYDKVGCFSEDHYPGFWKDGAYIKAIEDGFGIRINMASDSGVYIISRGTTVWWMMGEKSKPFDYENPMQINYRNPMQMAEKKLMHL